MANNWHWTTAQHGPSIKGDLVEHGRDGWHLILGLAIVVLPLILALVTRWTPRNRIIVGALAILLGVAIAGQLWLGVLLMYDTPDGPLTHFNRAESPAAMTAR